MKFSSYTTLFNQQYIANSTHSKISKDGKVCIAPRNINRRHFLKTGTAWMAALVSAQYLIKSNSAYGQAFSYDVIGNRIVKVVFKTGKDLVREMVPHPLKANDEGLMYAFIGHFNSMVNYAVFGVPASCIIPESDTTREVKGSFIKEWYTNEQWTVNVGKGYGYPRKLADVAYEESHDSIDGSVKHEGNQVARIKFLLPGKKETPLSFDKYERHFGSISIGGIKRLAITRFADYKEHKRESGNVEIELLGIEVHKVIEATYTIADWVLPAEAPTVFMEIVLK